MHTSTDATKPADIAFDLAEIASSNQRQRHSEIEGGREALARLVPVALRDTGQSGVIGRFLLSLYNATAFPFNPADLRRLDLALHNDCLAVLAMDRWYQCEVPEHLHNGGKLWEQIRKQWGGKHRG